MVFTRRACASALVAAIGACTADAPGMVDLDKFDAGPVITPSRDGAVRDARVVDAGPEKGPVVTLMGVEASADPVAGPVLSGSSVDVKCEAKQRTGGQPVDPGKVSVTLFADGVAEPVIRVPGVLQGPDLYAASVALEKVPTGKIRIRCAAGDTANPSVENAREVETFYDAGPNITFENLNATSVVARGKDTGIDLSVQFKVEPARLSPDDAEADVGDVKLTIADRDVPLDTPKGSEYVKGIDFSTFFDLNTNVDSVVVVVTATNKRAKARATSKNTVTVKVDGQGPVIVVTSPLGQGGPPLVGGLVTMQMTITDEVAGVAVGKDKVWATIGSKRFELTPTPPTYTFSFVAEELNSPSNNVSPHIYATDRAGNESEVTHTLRLDTVPPWVNLQPGLIRVRSGTPVTCSAPFKAIGNSPVDGQVIVRDTRFRALILERGILGGEIVHVSGIRNDSVRFYAQDDATVPLLKNSKNQGANGECDTINNSAAQLGSKAPFEIGFGPVTGTYGALPPGKDTFSAAPIVPAGYCAESDTGQAALRCVDSEMTYVLTQPLQNPPTAVFAWAPASTDVGCTGDSFDIDGEGGWVCVAVTARDGAGNLGLSAPIRVCRELEADDCGDPTKMDIGTVLTPPPTLTCTDGCNLPANTTVNLLGDGIVNR